MNGSVRFYVSHAGSLSPVRGRLAGSLALWNTALAAALLLLYASGSLADESLHRSAGGLDIYWGVLPAAMVLGHEQEHGGAKSARGAHHLVVAVFSAATGKRVADAEVEARVKPLGLAAEAKRLEPMTINQTVTFGNYFSMPGGLPYRITLRVRPAGAKDWIETTAEYRHGYGGD